MFGYHGRFLLADLGRGDFDAVALADADLRRFVGGAGLAVWLTRRLGAPTAEPLSADAPVVIAFSPLVGTPLTTSAKFALACKSPLTDRVNDSLSSSHFAVAGKATGFDAVALVGACREPSILLIDNGVTRLEPAGDLWGLGTIEASERLRRRLGPGWHAGVIGPAGERLVRYATVSFGGRHAGRGGTGAVLGSKLLKAIAVRGSRRVQLADAPAVYAAAKDLSRRSMGPATAKYRELGTVANLLTFNRLNALPTRNFQQGQFEGAEALALDDLADARRVARNSCAACTVGCEHVVATLDGRGVRMEYESLFALGPLCGVADPDAVARSAQLCDDLGLDTISAGATVAFAMECAQRGLIDAPDLRFGRDDVLHRTLKQIAARGGLGDLLADGTRRAADVIGGNSADFAPHVKGLELPGYEPRALQTMALGFAVGSRGADHNRSGAYEADFSARADRLRGTPESAVLAVETEDKAALTDSLILCKFLRGVFTDFYSEAAELLRPVTGWDVTGGELRQTARRVVTLRKLFNEEAGWTAAEDTLPKRFLSEGLPAGTSPGAELPAERLRAMVRAYYRARGWGDDGRVSAAEARQLGLA